MKSLKTILVASTALTFAGTAWADSNSAYLDQIGDDNAALITQSGASNRAGSSAADRVVTQSGDNNDLDILQSGDTNQVGVSGKRSAPGVDQFEDRNVFSAIQTSSTNYINVVQQTGVDGASETTNSLTITQQSTANFVGGSGGNVVSRVVQTNTGSGALGSETNSVNIRQDRDGYSGPRAGWGANVIGGQTRGNIKRRRVRVRDGVVQNGAGNSANLTQTGYRNSIQLVTQTGNENQATVTQTNLGSGTNNYNRVDLVSQDSTTGTTGNTVSVVQEGQRNGIAGFSAGSFAALTGVAKSSVTQIGGGNVVDYLATGNYNQFGFYQEGNGNTVGTVTITGNGNETAAYQMGDGNTVTIVPIVGDGNDVGAIQNGMTNMATVSLSNGSNVNSVGIDQNVTNRASVSIDGNNNYASLDQDGTNSGLSYGIDLLIEGNDNNRGAFAPGGDAAGVGLTVGLFVQDGTNNLLDIDVIGGNNDFATSQVGDDNIITASVTGSMNEFAVSQTNNGNVTNLIQTGNSNIAGIIQ